MIFRLAHMLTRCLITCDGGDYRATFGLAVSFVAHGGDVQEAMAAARARKHAADQDAGIESAKERARAQMRGALTGQALEDALILIDEMEWVTTCGTAHPPRHAGRAFRALRDGQGLDAARAILA